MNADGIEALLARLKKVEQRLRMTRLAWLLSVILLAVLASGMQQARSQQSAPAPGIVKQREFQVVDQSGRVRIALTTDREGDPQIQLNDSKGVRRALIAFDTGNDPGMWFYDERGKRRWSRQSTRKQTARAWKTP